MIEPAGTQPPQNQAQIEAAAKAAADKNNSDVVARVFALLMSLLGSNMAAVMGSLLPKLEREKVWEDMANGIGAILGIDPSKLTDAELDMFANGWESMAAVLKDPHAPASLKAWIKQIMNNPTFKAAFQKLFDEIKKLQEMKKGGFIDSKAYNAQLKKIKEQVAHIQDFGKKPDPMVLNPPPEQIKLYNDYRALAANTKTIVAAMTALTNITYAEALKVVNNVQNLTSYTSSLVKEITNVWQMINSGILA